MVEIPRSFIQTVVLSTSYVLYVYLFSLPDMDLLMKLMGILFLIFSLLIVVRFNHVKRYLANEVRAFLIITLLVASSIVFIYGLDYIYQLQRLFIFVCFLYLFGMISDEKFDNFIQFTVKGIAATVLTIFALKIEFNFNMFGYVLVIFSALLSFRLAGLLIISIACFILEADGAGFLALVFILFNTLFRFVRFEIINLNLFFLIVFLVSFQYFIAEYMYDDEFLNQILTKRPAIWGFYFDYILEYGYLSALGVGPLSQELAIEAGDYISVMFEHSRMYSPHSMYINTFFEFGFYGLLQLLCVSWLAYKKSHLGIISIVTNVLLCVGFVAPITFGGVRIYDVLIVMLISRMVFSDCKQTAHILR